MKPAEFQKRDEKKINIILGCLFLIFLTSLPLLTDFLLSGRYLQYQLLRIEALKDGFQNAGALLWSKPDWAVPQGWSFAFFYGDTFLYIPACFRLLGINVQMSYRLFLILVNAATVLLSCYSFKEVFQDAYSGLLGSALYSVSIYRIFLLYAEAELGEALALAFLPLVFLGAYRILGKREREEKSGWLLLALGISGILRSHILSFGITVFFLLLYWIVNIRQWKNVRLWKELGLSLAAFLLLNLNYLYAMSKYARNFVLNPTSGVPIQEKGIQIVQLFMCFYQAGGSHEFGVNGVEDAVPVGLGLVMLAVIFVFCYLLFVYGEEFDKTEKRSGWICFGFGIAGCALSTLCFPWDSVLKCSGFTASLISMMQAPWHFLQAALIAFSALGCITYGMVKKKYPAYGNGYGIGIAALGCFSASYLAANLLFTYDFVRIRTAEEVWAPFIMEEDGEEAAISLASGLQTCAADGLWYVLTAVGILTLAGCVVWKLKNRKKRQAVF